MGYTKKKTYKKKAYKKKPNTFKSNFRLGDYHQKSYGWYDSSYIPSTTARIKSRNISEIDKGDLLDNRQTNLVYLKNVQYTETLRNLANTTRYLRIIFLSVRGSLNSIDATNWNDLLLDTTFTKFAVQGRDLDAVARINQDEYVKIFDKVIKIPGAGSNENPAKLVRLNIPIKKYISYTYNDHFARKNAVYMISFMCESSGINPGALAVNSDGQLVTHYYDVIRSMRMP